MERSSKVARTEEATATLYAACLGQLGQFGNQVFQFAFASLYSELWGLSLIWCPKWQIQAAKRKHDVLQHQIL